MTEYRYEDVIAAANRARIAGDLPAARNLMLYAQEIRPQGFRPPAPTDRQAQIDESVMADIQRQGRAQLVEQNPLSARVVTAAQGIPFAGQWIDEATALVSPRTAETVRGLQQGMQEQHPYQTAALQMGTGVAASLPAAMMAGPAILARGTTLGGNIVRGALAGGGAGFAEGAVSGAGAADEGDRLSGAGSGALIGGALGTAIGGAAPIVSAGFRNLLSRFRSEPVDVIARELGIGEGPARVVRDAIQAEDFGAAQQAISRAGDRAMLADMGEATRTLLDAAATSGPEAARVARDAIQDRARAGGLEFVDILDNALGIPRGVRTAQSAVRQGTSAARGAAYDAAYAAPINYSSNAGMTLESLWGSVDEAAKRRAAQMMIRDRTPNLQSIITVLPDGTATVRSVPDVRTWDYVTRALNDMAESARGQPAAPGLRGIDTNESRSLSGLSRTIRTILRRAVPEYNQALQTAAQPARVIEAMDVGASLLRTQVSREMARDMVRGMTGPERDAARMGLRSYIDDMMAATRMTLTNPDADTREAIAAWRLLSSRRAQENIRFLLGADADDFLRQINRVAADFELQATQAANSRTAVRSAVQEASREAFQPPVLDVLAESGSIQEAGRRAVQGALGAEPGAQARREAAGMADVARALTATRGAAETQRIADLIGQSMQSQPTNQRRAELISRGLTGLLGSVGYQYGMQGRGQ